MKKDKRLIEEHVEKLMVRAKEAGVKLTHQRIEIFLEVALSLEHPNAEAVFQAVKKRMPTISLDTVYRTLWKLTDLGFITTLGRRHESVRFDANLDRHHHFICVRCGLTQDFYCEAFDELNQRRTVKDFGRIETMHVEVRGICNDCVKLERIKKNKSKNHGGDK